MEEINSKFKKLLDMNFIGESLHRSAESYDPYEKRKLQPIPVELAVIDPRSIPPVPGNSIASLKHVLITHENGMIVFYIGKSMLVDEFTPGFNKIDGMVIRELWLDKSWSLNIALEGARSRILKHGDKIGDPSITIMEIIPAINDLDMNIEQLTAIAIKELLARQFEFFDATKRWAMTNKDISNFAYILQQMLNNGAIKRDTMLDSSMDKAFLTKGFVSNVFSPFHPLIYHEFQARQVNEVFDEHDPTSELREMLLDSRFFSFQHFKNTFNSRNTTMDKKTRDNLFLALSKTVSGAFPTQEKGEIIWHPHWFDDDFATRWREKLRKSYESIIKTHFPLLVANGKIKDWIVPENEVQAILGHHMETMQFLFKIPIINLHVFHPLMRWDHLNPRFFYDGIFIIKPENADDVGVSDPEKFVPLAFKPGIVSRTIIIHPLQLFMADMFGWDELVRQTLHHEIVHVLQMKFTTNMMTGQFLKNPRMLKTETVKRSLSYLDHLKSELPINQTIDLLEKVNDQLYIHERIPQELEHRYNLDDYISMHGGHTNAFITMMQNFKEKEIAWIQRREFFQLINNFAYRLTGESITKGFVFLGKPE